MFLDVRKSNWIEYLDQVEQNLIDGSPITTPTSAKGYAHKYWKWVIGDQTYTSCLLYTSLILIFIHV